MLNTYLAVLWRSIALLRCSWPRYWPWTLSQTLRGHDQASVLQCRILSSEASNLHTNFEVHTIGPSSLHLPCSSTSLAIQSYNFIGKEQKKISCIFVYRYLSNHYSFVNRRFLFSYAMNSWMFLSNQSSISFLVGFQWCDIQHLFMQILVPTTKPFVGLVGPDPGSELSLLNKSLHYWPFRINSRCVDWSLTRSSMGGVLEPSFCTQRWVWCHFTP